MEYVWKPADLSQHPHIKSLTVNKEGLNHWKKLLVNIIIKVIVTMKKNINYFCIIKASYILGLKQVGNIHKKPDPYIIICWAPKNIMVDMIFRSYEGKKPISYKILVYVGIR